MRDFSSVQLGPCVAFVVVVLDGTAGEWYRGGGPEMGPSDICHTNHPQSAGSSRKPESTARGNDLGALSPLQRVAQVSWVSANTFSAQRKLKNSWVYTWGSPAAGRNASSRLYQSSLGPRKHHLAVKNGQGTGCPWLGADVQLHPHIPG